MRVGIIGLGYVGLTLAVAAAVRGVDVYGVETNTHIKDCLKQDKAHFYEPGLDNLIKRVNNKSFHVVERFPAVEGGYDAFIITVGTPLKKVDGKKQEEPNFEYIKSALEGTLKDIYDGSQLIILRSTVSVGTTRNIVRPFLAQLCGRQDRKSTRLNSSHPTTSRMPSSA